MFKTIINNFHLEKLIWIIKSKLLYMILAALIGAVLLGAYGTLTQSSTYQAQISFYVYTNPDYVTDTGVNLSSSDISQANKLLASYKEILSSATFLNKVIEYTGLENYTVSALQRRIKTAAVEETAVFKVYVVDANPVNAMNIANAIGELAPDEIISIVKSGGIEVLDEAELPKQPYSSTSVITYIIMGAAAGFMLVAVIAVVTGLLDTRIRRLYEIEDLFTIPILGTVPQLKPNESKESVDPVLNDNSSFEYKEAYSNIRINLLFGNKEEKCPVYAISSADCGEGKTLTALNLATSFAMTGRKILLLDADLRNSSMANFLKEEDIKSKDGLSEYLTGKTNKLNVIHNNEYLDIVLAGEKPANPAELLVNDKWYELIHEYKKTYNAIFIDLSALGIVSDALTLVREATAYILVVREQMTRFEREEMIVRKLEALEANICGFIYNGISMKSPDYNLKRKGKEYKLEEARCQK